VIYYTYPDAIEKGKKFDVGVTLEYRKDSAVVSNWLAFTNVSISLKNYSSPYDTGILDTRDNLSAVVRPGEKYAHSFTLTAPETPGKYLVFPKWTAWFGPGSSILENFEWDMDNYYNHTERDRGIVYPEELPPIDVKDGEHSEIRKLNVQIDEPYGKIKPVTVHLVYENKSSSIFEIKNGKIGRDLLTNSKFNLSLDREIEMPSGNIRAVFVSWSDGNNSNPRPIELYQNQELFALYKTQYFLNVSSEERHPFQNISGSGWYDSGSQRPYSITPTYWILSSFDHWVGDISDNDDSSAGHLTMDGPKEIKAIWKRDYTVLAASVSAIGGVLAVIELLFKKKK
jgi:hypothetical protein